MITIAPILIDLPETILGSTVVLKPTKPGDGEIYREAMMEDYSKFTEYMGHMDEERETPSLEVVEAQCRLRYVEYIQREKCLHYNIYDKQDNYLGFFEFTKMDWYGGFTKMSGWLRPSARNQGYMTDTINTMVDFAFDTMDMKRVATWIDEDNLEALALMDRVGFEQEGVLKEAWVKRNEENVPANMVTFAKLRSQDLKQAA